MLRKIKDFLFGRDDVGSASIEGLHDTIVSYLNSKNIRIKFIDEDCHEVHNQFTFTDEPVDIIVVDEACTIRHVKKILDLFNMKKLNGIITIIYDTDIYFARPIIEDEAEFIHQLFPDLSCSEIYDMLLNKDGVETLPREILPSRETYRDIKETLCPKL